MQKVFSSAYLKERIQRLPPHDFDELVLDVFRYQATQNPLYAEFLTLLGVQIPEVTSIKKIPFLPISLFKNYKIQSGDWEAETIFTSSGTTGQISSQHHVKSRSWYLENAKTVFEYFYGKPKDYCFLALLPSYLERQGSSLVDMVQEFIQQSKYKESGFFLNDFTQMKAVLLKCIAEKIPTILLGVSFGLLDFAEQSPMNLENVIIMETGGMKGRRKEMTREELHLVLKTAFQVKNIHSEYGMTELLSQAYSKGNGIFQCSPTMKILSREITDPLSLQKTGRIGAINIIDLANLDTCSFIATDDLGKVYEDGSFEILGRMDASDIRGCNLMVGEG